MKMIKQYSLCKDKQHNRYYKRIKCINTMDSHVSIRFYAHEIPKYDIKLLANSNMGLLRYKYAGYLHQSIPKMSNISPNRLYRLPIRYRAYKNMSMKTLIK